MSDDTKCPCNQTLLACANEVDRLAEKLVAENARLTRELEQAQAACAAMRGLVKSFQFIAQAKEPSQEPGDYYWTRFASACREVLAQPNPGQPLLDRLAAAEAVVARVQDRDFTWTCPHIDCEDSSACEDAMLAAILQETNRDS